MADQRQAGSGPGDSRAFTSGVMAARRFHHQTDIIVMDSPDHTDSRPSTKCRMLLSYMGRYYHRAIWTACTLASTLTSRKLLVDLNWHFPLHLLLLQLVTAIIITSITLLWRQSETFHTQPTKRSQWLSTSLLAVAIALSLIFSTQALLHVENLPTLPMLTLVSWTVEELTFLVRDTSQYRRDAVVRILFPAFACVGILIGEYRLSVKGLLTAIPAVLFAGAARALRHVVHEKAAPNFDTVRLNMLVCCVGLATIGAVYSTEPLWHPTFFFLAPRYWPLLAINAMSTATAILLGQSTLFPMDEVVDGPCTWPNIFPTDREWSATHTPSLLVGVVGLASTLTVRGCYMSHSQLLAFALALIVMSRLPATWGLEWGKNHGQPARLDGTHIGTVYSHCYGTDTKLSERAKLLIAVQRNIATMVLLPAIWIPFLILNFSETLYSSSTTASVQLDQEYTPQVPVELVISMFKEPVEDVAKQIAMLQAMPNLGGAAVHIYVKDSSADLKQIQYGTGATKVTRLENVGREGETFLHHILEQWDSLARHTVFLQAAVHNPREFYPRIRNYFHPMFTGMLSLGWPGHVCNCDDCGDKFGWYDSMHLFRQVHSRIYNETACEKVLLSYKGQFIVSAKRIRGLDKGIYRDLHTSLVDPNSWAHREAVSTGHADSMSQPYFGFTIERIWNLLFQCNDMDVARKCPTLLSGNREGRDIGDCQCFDRDE